MRTVLTYHDAAPSTVEKLAGGLGISRILAALMLNRNIDTPERGQQFLNPSLEKLCDPFLMADMDIAVNRIRTAIENNEKILIFGDFDADGVTATCLLNDFFTHLNADVTWYIPHRSREGYSLQPMHVKMAAEINADLIITVDCGSSSHEAVDHAAGEDIDVIITDHHEVETPLPGALAVINPKRPDCPSKLHYLAGVGVAFYLIIALRKHLRDHRLFDALPEPNLLNYSDLVALGTIGDMVPLINENRILCVTGLNIMRTRTRPGIKALSDVSRIDCRHIDSDDISYKIIPKINAAGRMSHARICVTHLSSDFVSNAQETATILDQLNIRRQQVEKQIVDTIGRRIINHPDILQKRSIVLWDDNWNASVLGIAASKLAKKYARPVILISTAADPPTGSGRSVEGVDILALLQSCRSLLKRFGGHAMAAGLSLDTADLETFARSFDAAVQQSMPDDDFQRTVLIDRELSLNDITMDLLADIDRLRPFGVGNPEPVFISSRIQVLSSTIIGINHRKMVLQHHGDLSGRKVDAFHFNLEDTSDLPLFYETIVYRVKLNKFSMKSVQIILEDL